MLSEKCTSWTAEPVHRDDNVRSPMEEHLSNLHPMLCDLRVFIDDIGQFRIIHATIKNQLCLVVHCNDLAESSMTVFGRIEATWK